MFFRERVLPDGPTARGAATSWRLYLSCWYEPLWASRWSAIYHPDQREDLLCLFHLDQLKRRVNARATRSGPVRKDISL
jgi:hypothetical protein